MPAGSPLNPFRSATAGEEYPEAATVVIFGATGDLTRRKLFPALHELVAGGLAPLPLSVIGFGRQAWSDGEFRDRMKRSLAEFSPRGAPDEDVWRHLAERLRFVSAGYDDPAGYLALTDILTELRRRDSSGVNVVYYLATPPDAAPAIIRNLGESGLSRPAAGWARIIVEKPFGRDLESARRLNSMLLSVFDESQIYRIDHYLGKETVQNLLVLRFANGIFEPLWNRRYIGSVQLTVSEELGMEGRGAYFEEAGILRDMVQNHVLQLLSLFAMEPPSSFSPEAVRNEKVKVLQAIRPMTPADIIRDTVRGQYGPGLIEGREVPGYREEPSVSPSSGVETYVAMKLLFDNWRWAGVPFFVRTGKRLARRGSVISIEYRSVPHLLFRTAGGRLEPNVLTIRIQPQEGISLQFETKVPGPRIDIRPVTMDFQYGTSFSADIPDAYVRLILDCLLGDSTLFNRRDEIEASWVFIDAIREAWKTLPPLPFPNYEAGTWGPPGADAFVDREGRRWRAP
jgi:glucose-6-phosphate 1-dehydrogenase